jgi:hypothetical protein
MLSGGEGLIAVMSNPRRNAKGRFVKSGHKKHASHRKSGKRRKSHHAKHHSGRAVTVRVASNPKHKRRVHRNPRFSFGLGGIGAELMGAGMGAGGALAVDLGITFLATPDAQGKTLLPTFLQTGIGRIGIRSAAALGMGWLAKFLFGSRVGQAATLGALTVVVYDVGRSALNQFVLPATMQLSESDYSDLTMAGLAHAGSTGYGDSGRDSLTAYQPQARLNGYVRQSLSGAPAIHPTVSAFVDGPTRSGSFMEGLNADLEM